MRAYRVAIDGPAAAGAPPKLPVKVGNRDRLSIAVLPFQNMSGDAGAGLFRRRHFRRHHNRVVETVSALRHRPQLLILLQGQECPGPGDRQELSASAMCSRAACAKSDKRVRITAQLIDATYDGHLWAERFDRDLTDIFVVQDDVTGQIVSALSLNLTQSDAPSVDGGADRQYGGLRLLPARAGTCGGGSAKSPTPRRGSCCFAPPNSTRNSRRPSLGWVLTACQRLCQSMERLAAGARSTSRIEAATPPSRSMPHIPFAYWALISSRSLDPAL